MSERDILTVTELTKRVKSVIEAGFREVWVVGEVVGFKRHSSGHLYFTLKDAGARLNAMVFRSQVRFLAVRPEELRDGAQVRCRGRLNLYEPHGAYKIIVDQMQFEGQGSLLEQLEKLKRQLASEGLFDGDRKQPLPLLPGVVGIVTASTGAAIKDMVRVINERCPTHVRLYPAAVQGEGAAKDIARGLRVLDRDPEVDVIIVGRGGGAFEDLLPFSDERVVRAIASSRTPVISAVGHEVDFPLCDLAADVRAPTPTGAAQLVVPERDALYVGLAQSLETMARRAGQLLEEQELRLADRIDRLAGLADQRLERATNQLTHLTARLEGAHPASRLDRQDERLASLRQALDRAIDRRLSDTANRLERAGALLEELGPHSQFRRGYALVRNKAGLAVTDSQRVDVGEAVDVILAKGQLKAKVTDSSP